MSLEKRFKARQYIARIGKYDFLARRPTEGEIARWEAKARAENLMWLDMLQYFAANFVDDWSLKEIDLFSDGTENKASFDKDVLIDWLNENIDVMVELVDSISQSFLDYRKLKDDDQKKSSPGSTIERSMSSSAAPSA